MRISINTGSINFYGTKKNQPVYSVDENKNLQKFDTRKIAAETLGVNSSAISGVLAGHYNRAGMYTFFAPEEIEKMNSAGEIQIDTQKVQEAQYKITPAIYVIDKDKNYMRFNSQIEASRTLGVATGNISRCIHSEAGKCRGFIFVLASEIEKTDENGNEVVDIAKIEKLANSLNQDSAIYVIDENGSFSRFDTPSDGALDNAPPPGLSPESSRLIGAHIRSFSCGTQNRRARCGYKKRYFIVFHLTPLKNTGVFVTSN